nr:MAG TPA: hypothetical protein [Caudoviricetes sp.]
MRSRLILRVGGIMLVVLRLVLRGRSVRFGRVRTPRPSSGL